MIRIQTTIAAAALSSSSSSFANTAVLRITVKDPHGNHVITKESNIKTHSTSDTFHISNGLLWTAETPHLYSVELSLLDGNAPIHNIDTHLGIRITEVKHGNLLVNNKAILLRGMNRHDNNSVRGRAVNGEDVKHDLLLMKKHNVNAIRCSHYPSHPSVLHWADILGFYVIDEADLECHGFGTSGYLPDPHIPNHRSLSRTDPKFYRQSEKFTSDNPVWKKAYLDRVQQMTARDKNHPAVVMWSLGNESFFGSNHREMYKWLKEHFPHPVHYEGDWEDTASAADVVSRMYPSHDYLEREGSRQHPQPFIVCEYAHSMGNGPGALLEYQELFYKYPRLQGGFIWEWASHGLRKPVPGQSDKYFHAYGGDFNEPVHDGTFVMDGICNSEHLPTPGLIQYKRVVQPVDFVINKLDREFSIEVKNLHDFVTLDQFYVQVTVEHVPSTPWGASYIIEDKRFDFDKQVVPGESSQFKISVDVDPSELVVTASLRLKEATLWAPKDYEIAFDQYVATTPHTASGSEDVSRETVFSVEESRSSYIITSATASLRVSRSTGRLSDIAVNGRKLVDSGPVLSFWRAPTDNDKGGIVYRWKDYHIPHLQESVDSVEVNTTDGGMVIKVHSWVAPSVVQWGIDTVTTYTLAQRQINGKPSLVIDTSIDMVPKGPYCPTVPRIGLDFVLADNLCNVTWAGRDVETYPDSKVGGRIGVHTSHKDGLYTEYEVPQDNGNRADVHWVTLSEDVPSSMMNYFRRVEQGSFSAVCHDKLLNFSVQPWNPFQLDEANHPYELKDEDRRNNFRVDFDVYGLGSASCGPETLEKYRLHLKPAKYSVKFVIN
jgi:beta-galactosidase